MFTRGNWKSKGDTVYSDNGVVLASFVTGAYSPDFDQKRLEAEANARLFANSKKLYDTCVEILRADSSDLQRDVLLEQLDKIVHEINSTPFAKLQGVSLVSA